MGLLHSMCATAEEAGMDSVPRLPTVHVRARGGGVHVREDTTEYTASAYRSPDVRKVQDLLAKLEGFSVTPDGRVHINGQEIETILVNGEDMAGSNYRLLSRYLRAGMVKKIQLIHDYDPDPLMHDMRRSGKVGLSLVLYDSLSRTISGGVDIGVASVQRKDMDLHLLDLQGNSKGILLGSWNGTGLTATNNREFYAGDDAQGQVDTRSGARISPVATGQIEPPLLPDAYLRDNDDRSASLIWKHTLRAGRRIGMVLGADGYAMYRAQELRSSCAPPDGSTWKMVEQEQTADHGHGMFWRSEYVADRGRAGRSRIWVDLFRNRERDVHEDEVSGALRDGLKEMDRMCRTGLQGHMRDSRRLRQGALLLECDIGRQGERQCFDVISRSTDSGGLSVGTGSFKQQWKADEWRQGLALKYVPAAKRRSGFTVRYDGLESRRSSGSTNAGMRMAGVDLTRHAMTLETDAEYKAGRHARWQWAASMGIGSWRYGAMAQNKAVALHDVGIGYVFRSGPFRTWAFSYRDAQLLPEDKYVLPKDMASGRYKWITPQHIWKPGGLHQFSCRYSARNLAAGMGMLAMFGFSRREHVVLPALYLKPGLTRIMPEYHGRSDDLHGSLSGDVLLEPVKMRFNGDIHVLARWSSAVVNDVRSERVMRNMGCGLRLTTVWKSAVNLDAGFTVEHNLFMDRTGTGEQLFSAWSGAMRLKIRLRWGDRWYAAAAAERYVMPGRPSFLATDMFLTWQCHPRLGFSLTAHNLLGRESLSTHWVSAGAEGETIFRVVPAYLLVKWSWAI